MEVAQPRITELGFKTTIGLFLGIALSLAAGRTYIRIVQTRKITVDDGFFYLAVAALIAGTTTCYVDIPYLYVQQNVDPKTTVITPAFINLLIHSLKIQAATDVLLSTTLFAVKLSFLFFFHGLLRRLRSLTIWWWCILVIMVPFAVVFMSFIFIVCPYFDERVLVKCSTPSAMTKQNNILRASAFMDIFTDVLLITIPVSLLWRVRISLRRKLLLGFILSLSIFTMIVSIVRIAGADLANGLVDSIWVNFWLQIEATVAVMIVSITAYRSLFVADKTSNGRSPKQYTSIETIKKRIQWKRRDKGKAVQLPTLQVPDPAMTGMRSVIRRADGGFGDRSSGEEGLMEVDSRRGLVGEKLEV